MDIGERIKQIRKENGLTLMKFGGRLGISAQAISLIEKGTNAPSDQTIRFVCREFHINEEWLRTGEGEPHQVTYQDSLWNIVQSRGLDTADYALISGIMDMPAEGRKALIAAIVDIADKVKRGEPLTPIPTMAVVEQEQPEDPAEDAPYRTEEEIQRDFGIPAVSEAELTPPISGQETWDGKTREELHAELDRRLDEEKDRALSHSSAGAPPDTMKAG